MEMHFLGGKRRRTNGLPNLQSGIETEQSATHVLTFVLFEVSRSSFTLKIRNLISIVSFIKLFLENLILVPVVSYT